MENLEKFINNFKLPRDGFSSPVSFVDAFGFSVVKKNKKEFGYASLYKFYIQKDFLNKNQNIKPLVISASYGEENDEGGILISSSAKKLKKTRNSPVDLVSVDEYFYDIKNNTFFYKNKNISAEDLLAKIESLHIKPTLFFAGFWLRLKLFLVRVLLLSVIHYLYLFFKEFLHLISGTVITKDNIYTISMSRDRFEDKKKKEEKENFANEKIDIFGYQASAWSVVVYASVHFAIYVIWYLKFKESNFDFAKIILKNAFLTLTYVIPTLVFFERIIPMWLQLIIINLSKLYNNIAFMKLKV